MNDNEKKQKLDDLIKRLAKQQKMIIYKDL